MNTNILSKIVILLSLIKLFSLIMDTRGIKLGPEKSWTYELKSIVSNTSDAEKAKFDLEIERISRGVYAISGVILLNFDLAEGDSNKIAAKSYRSAQGNSDYSILPYQIAPTHLIKVFNTYYKDILMDTLKNCSDLPVFELEFQLPLEKREYRVNGCQFSQDGLPNHLQEGFYKVLLFGTGEVEWQIEVTVEVTNDI